MFGRKKKCESVPATDDFEKNAAGSYDRLFRAAYFHTGNREDAQDLVQESFRLAQQSYEKFRGDSTFYTWLYGIFRNVLKNSQRRKMLFVSKIGSLVEDQEADDRAAAPDNPYTLLVKSEQYHAVHNAVSELPEAYREALFLRHFEDFSYDEIARILGCPAGTVKSRIFKARMLLRKKLG